MKSTFITGFAKFSGRTYPEGIESLVAKLAANNNSYLPNLLDVSDELSEFVNDPSHSVAYNPNIPFHKQIVLVDLFRLTKMKELLDSNQTVGWIDADLLITDPVQFLNGSYFGNVITKRPPPVNISHDLSNGIMYTDNVHLLDDWIDAFTKIDPNTPVDFSHFSRGLLVELEKKHRIKSLGDVISFTSYHDTNEWKSDLEDLQMSSDNLIGYNLSFSWKMDEVHRIYNNLTRK